MSWFKDLWWWKMASPSNRTHSWMARLANVAQGTATGAPGSTLAHLSSCHPLGGGPMTGPSQRTMSGLASRRCKLLQLAVSRMVRVESPCTTCVCFQRRPSARGDHSHVPSWARVFSSVIHRIYPWKITWAPHPANGVQSVIHSVGRAV